MESWYKETFEDILEEKKKWKGKMKAFQQDVLINWGKKNPHLG